MTESHSIFSPFLTNSSKIHCQHTGRTRPLPSWKALGAQLNIFRYTASPHDRGSVTSELRRPLLTSLRCCKARRAVWEKNQMCLTGKIRSLFTQHPSWFLSKCKSYERKKGRRKLSFPGTPFLVAMTTSNYCTSCSSSWFPLSPLSEVAICLLVPPIG